MKYIQISYPRSGANYLRYIARLLLEIDKRYLEKDNMDELYIKRHDQISQCEINEPGRKLIILLRDPFECINRHNQINKANIDKYISILVKYKSCPNDKTVIYYEELITEPYRVIREFSEFLDRDPTDILDNLEKIKEDSLKGYTKIHASVTRGKRVTHHKDTLKQAQIDKWTDIFQSQCGPDILRHIERYL
jgi:hypothetical protein